MSCVLPDWYAEDLRQIDWPQVKQMGIRKVFLDIDNTLAMHGAELPDAYSRDVVAKIQAAGLRLSVLSNAKAARGEAFAQALQLSSLGQAGKPLPYKLLARIRSEQLEAHECLMVGDQILTDVLCAKWAKIPVLLVKKRSAQEPLGLRFKRKIEALLASLGKDPKAQPRLPRLLAVEEAIA